MLKRLAIVDIGTNTCLLLIAEKQNDRVIKLYDHQEIPRLGEGVDKSRNISEESLSRLLKVLKKYQQISFEYNAENIIACATSAMRDANNRDEIINFIKDKIGLEIEIITGSDEAKFSYEGAVFDFQKNNYVVLDIGGGSTEFCYKENESVFSKSIDIGSVRLKEKFPSKNDYIKCSNFIKSQLKNFDKKIFLNKKLIGVAGTITTLSTIKNKLNKFKEDKIHKDTITFEDVSKIYGQLSVMESEDILSIGEFMKGRNDIIIYGVMILKEIMDFLGFKEITVSTKGLRYGIFLNYC